MKPITKAVILCGGLGTRFLPITKSVPKEMLPVIDTPVLGHIIAEAIDSGITDILIVLSPGKEAIERYFLDAPILEKKLLDSKNFEALEALKKITSGANFNFVVQKSPLGSGDAVLHAEKFCSGEPFVLALGDDLIYNKDNPVCGQLIKAYQKKGASILGVQSVLTDDIIKYGVADTGGVTLDEDKCAKMRGIVEKPPLDRLPSRLAALGRYILTPDIFDTIKTTLVAKNGELQLTDSINAMARNGNFYAYDFIGKRYDMGDKFGSVCAIVDYALRDEVFGERFREYLCSIRN
ncbi:MAG: UTP--glucose-1-phosphate uridylyltransferase [Firmicutes bacterium]|nr:UTP--glucose-1-phosphate uridylyltransferase [Bacillota bacterium]